MPGLAGEKYIFVFLWRHACCAGLRPLRDDGKGAVLGNLYRRFAVFLSAKVSWAWNLLSLLWVLVAACRMVVKKIADKANGV